MDIKETLESLGLGNVLDSMPDVLGLKELEERFANAEAPDPAEMVGEFHVDLEPNPVGDFRPAKQKKLLAGDQGQGHMSALGAIEFGYFNIEPGQATDGSGPCVKFVYDREENPAVLRGVVDEVRKEGSDRYLGKLYLNVADKMIFLFYFSMQKA